MLAAGNYDKVQNYVVNSGKVRKSFEVELLVSSVHDCQLLNELLLTAPCNLLYRILLTVT